MDTVMINQLPELAIPRNRTFKTINKASTYTVEKRNPYISKWFVLFDSDTDQWISFQPKVGSIVYPCYACRDMFGGKNSFLDHVNRRGLVLKYRCSLCKRGITFYNTCSFLLHVRSHFTEKGGKIDLNFVEITSIPMDLAGFLPIPQIPRLYDTADEIDNENLILSTTFYKPNQKCKGQRFVHFQPNDLIFFSSSNSEIKKNPNYNDAMVIKQINETIPKCIFVPMSSVKTILKTEVPDSSDISATPDPDSDIISLQDESNSLLVENTSYRSESVTPKIQVKNLNSLMDKQQLQMNSDEDLPQDNHPCYECKENVISLFGHYQKINKPIMDELKCKKCGLISTSICSLQAHMRTHDKKEPFICPECGKYFNSWNDLNGHMEFVCFHTAKSVRYKCPAKKCGKIFAQTITFSSHFPIAHMKVRFACTMCPEYFINEFEYRQHMKEHEDNMDITCLKIHECTVCLLPAENIKRHVLNHVQDKDNRIFVYICRYCKSYYRSKQTYAAHLLKCSKLLLNNQVKKEVQRIDSHNELKCKVIKFCKPCYCKIQFHCAYKDIKHVASCCPQCLTPFSDSISFKNRTYFDFEYTSNSFVKKNPENNSFICIMCNETLNNGDNTFDYENHLCKYKKPVVILNINYNIDRKINTLEEKEQEHDKTPVVIEETTKKKRKRVSNGSAKNKKNTIDKTSDDLLTFEPILFDGEYKCKICDYTNESRKLFHEHVQTHRNVSTSYQCMECGECFVVKPSLLKHLQVFHLIKDAELYIKENECFDKEAVRILEQNMRMVPGEVKEPVAENQCKVCRQLFSDAQELSKHFRVHGMAFLMKKIK